MIPRGSSMLAYTSSLFPSCWCILGGLCDSGYRWKKEFADAGDGTNNPDMNCIRKLRKEIWCLAAQDRPCRFLLPL